MKNKILVVGSDASRFENRGEIVHRPLIRLEPVKFTVPRVSQYDWIVFTSKYGIIYFIDRMRLKKSYRFAVIGMKTAMVLEEYGYKADIVASVESSKGLINEFLRYDIKDKRILIPGSDLSRDYLKEELGRQGAVVTKLVVYKNMRQIQSGINFSEIKEIVFTSPSTVNSFMSQYKGVPEGIAVYCIGEVTENELSKYSVTPA